MLICITDRTLCQESFLMRIEELAKGRPHAIMLREKDLSLQDYEMLARKVVTICQQHDVPLIINQNITVAKFLQIPNIHLSIQNLKKSRHQLFSFVQIGASIHSIEEAIEAEKLGATYLVAGHIYATNSKRNVPPKGLLFLQDVCKAVSIPVFAIGGITKENVEDTMKTGAIGICIMSESMTSQNPKQLTQQFFGVS